MKYAFEVDDDFDIDAFYKELAEKGKYSETNCKEAEYEESECLEDYRSYAWYDIF